jgi:hypothetical protein
MRRLRFWIASIALAGFLFAQLAAAAYACMAVSLGEGPMQTQATSSASPAASSHCSESAEHSNDDPSLCTAHCQLDKQLDSPFAASLPVFAPAPSFIVAVPEVRIPLALDPTSQRASGPAPPSILFSRFLS